MLGTFADWGRLPSCLSPPPPVPPPAPPPPRETLVVAADGNFTAALLEARHARVGVPVRSQPMLSRC
jgi:hypothetical protein